ncbi:hypothetical protein LIER_27387 [Lithospermum erythrorhizon]|uniref:Uncharacterized protein n=1 Tax=Lithospermum erythrorhizon TaxID=34254 RepID=A0AAV3RDW0_LITER
MSAKGGGERVLVQWGKERDGSSGGGGDGGGGWRLIGMLASVLIFTHPISGRNQAAGCASTMLDVCGVVLVVGDDGN